ncbi:MAG: hypothetical protein LCH92_08080 [Proteobacteria bacterium]|nr:hypothetical protein [Pseudomonadota bacterium]
MPVVIKSLSTSTAPDLVTLRRDPILTGDNGGVTFMFDLAFRYCWAGGNPIGADVVKDAADVGDGAFVETGDGTIFAGGGFDFAAPITNRAYVEGPAGCLASIHGGPQYFMVVGWYKMPTSEAWYATGGSIAPMFQCAATSYSAGPELVTWSQSSIPRIDYRRQTNGSTFQGGNTDPNANIFGQVTQIAYWRNAGGVGMRMRSALGTVLLATVVGDDNVGDFSAMKPKWGVPPGFGAAPNTRLYRGWIEDLAVSERAPLTVLDDDFTRVIARGAFT